MLNLDEMIMDVETSVIDTSAPNELPKIRVKFIAIAGGTGPELVMSSTLATRLLEKLHEVMP